MNPTVSVLITFYNDGGRLFECLESIRQQTIPVDEIIIYDDASDVGPESFIPAGINPKIIKGKTNIGQGLARNILCEHANSSYVHFQDADDLLHKNWCEKIKKYLSNTSVDIVFTEVSKYRSQGIVAENYLNIIFLKKTKDLISFFLKGTAPPIMSTVRKELVLQSGGFKPRSEFRLSEDMEFHLRLALLNPSYGIIFEPLALQRWEPNSSCRDSENAIKIECHYYSLKTVLTYRDRLGPKHQPYLKLRAKWCFDAIKWFGSRDLLLKSIRLAEDMNFDCRPYAPRIYTVLKTVFGKHAFFLYSLYRKAAPSAIQTSLSKKV